VPTALIGRLTISNAAQEHGVGKLLLADAIKRTLAVNDQIAIYAIVVDAINDNAKGFYEQFVFFAPFCGYIKFKWLGRKRHQITISVKPHRPFTHNDLEITALCKFFLVGLRNVNFT
jgi:hypothetical protein